MVIIGEIVYLGSGMIKPYNYLIIFYKIRQLLDYFIKLNTTF
jgi:hypothetical protein